MSMTAQDLYGGPVTFEAPPASVSAGSPMQQGKSASATDPHDKIDRGPTGLFDDPVIWLVLIAGLATGVLGLRFRWFRGGAEAGVKVKLGAELATLFGVTLYAITGIVVFKIIASKIKIPALQELAAAI